MVITVYSCKFYEEDGETCLQGGEIRCACVQSLSNKHIYKALDHVPLLEKCVSIIREL